MKQGGKIILFLGFPFLAAFVFSLVLIFLAGALLLIWACIPFGIIQRDKFSAWTIRMPWDT